MKTDLQKFTDAYLEALFFAEVGGDSEIPDDAELSEETQLNIEAECRSFWRRFGCYINTETCQNAFNDTVKQAGHDFYLTRNGHGVGFWETEWPKPYRDMLTKGAESYGPMEIYLGDDGLIYD